MGRTLRRRVGVCTTDGTIRQKCLAISPRPKNIYFHAWSEEADLADAALPPSYGICGMELLGMTPEEKRRHRESLPLRAEYRAGHLRDAAYHDRVRRKFERAAWRPWEPLPDDPRDPPPP
jgi:hypothetical protein